MPGISLQDMVSTEMYEHIDLCAKQIWYWRKHLDAFIIDYLKIQLYDLQRVIARGVGNGDEVSLALLRGSGKTWLLGVCSVAMSILWPDSPILCVSNTAEQANLLLQKIERELLPNENISREIDYSPRHGIKIKTTGKSCIYYKDGSTIQAIVLGRKGDSALGLRGKVMIVDEAKLVPSSICNMVLKPILSYKRKVFYALKESGFKDYTSKIINISSAFLKTCDFYQRYKATLKRMATGDSGAFACALDFNASIRMGIEDSGFYERARETMTSVEFACEYGTVFVGESDNAVFPYALVEPCRVLNAIEITQPKGTTSRYIIAADVAGNGNIETSDNSCIEVLKIVETSNGRWQKHLVWIGAYRGLSQRQLAEEIRKVYLRFPNTVQIVYDANAIGRGLESLFDEPYQYVDEKDVTRELPPLLPYNSTATYRSVKILYPFIANNTLNNEMVNIMLRNFQDLNLRLPLPSTFSGRESILTRLPDDEDTSDESDTKKRRTMLMTEEACVFKEADELQVELGNIVRRLSVQGNPIFGTAISTQRKDRFSTLGMGMWYIDSLETVARRVGYTDADDEIPVCVGNI